MLAYAATGRLDAASQAYTTVPGDPTVVCGLRAADDSLKVSYWGAASLPRDRFNAGGVLASNPICLRTAPGRPVYCFVQNTNNALSAISCTERGCGAWVDAGGVLNSRLSCVGGFRPGTARWAEADIITCFVRGTDSTLFRIGFEGARVYRPWERVTGDSIDGAASCIQYPGLTGEILCAARRGDHLGYTRFDGRTWSRWALGAAEPISGDPHCVYRASDDQVHCAARDASGRFALISIPRAGSPTRTLIGTQSVRAD